MHDEGTRDNEETIPSSWKDTEDIWLFIIDVKLSINFEDENGRLNNNHL